MLTGVGDGERLWRRNRRAQARFKRRPRVARKVENAIRTRLARGEGILKVAKGLGVGVSTAQRIKAEGVRAL